MARRQPMAASSSLDDLDRRDESDAGSGAASGVADIWVKLVKAGTRCDSARLPAASMSGCTALSAARATSNFSFASDKVSRNVYIGVFP